MKKISLDTNWSFNFVYKKDAEQVLKQAKEIAGLCGYVTVADICDLTGKTSTYTESLVGWSYEAIEKAEICWEHYNDGFGLMFEFVLYLPQCDWEKNEYTKEAEDTEKPSTGEPINITISSNEWNTRRNDIEQVFNELFRNSDKIKDRPVFINIM